MPVKSKKVSIARTVAPFVIATSLVVSLASQAVALPWDFDMYRQQSLKPNEVARGPVKGTVPLGYTPFTLDVEKADGLSNPREANLNSVWRGQRLYNSNCYTCHGKVGDGKGPVGPLMGVPDLHQDLYKSKSDGRFFAVITKGLRTMPRYGYKFSESEKWDIVNYLRVLQGNKEVAGFSAPTAKGK